ncbi:MAG: molybdopterin molybdotransferase MoeA [Actinomycetaceae bacterium]|nr:molybdopterin molybdotransferase MoeA [Actinomycetaceae bacterium]
MRTVSQHLAECLKLVAPLPPLEVMLPDATGCVVAEDVRSPINLPVADLAGCDGYAVAARDTVGAATDSPVVLSVIDEIRAGSMDATAIVPGTAVRIASGAPLPSGADAVLALEHTNMGVETVDIYSEAFAGMNVRACGQDVAAGDIIVHEGERVGARQIALVAGVGRNRLSVHPHPRVVVVSIGDELVEPGQPATPGAVYDANGHALAAAVADAGAMTFRVAAVPDEHRRLRETIEDQLVRADLIITTGGLSYSAGDTVKEVLAPLGTIRFDEIAMFPGKQMGVGTVGEGTPIFCLPGDPVAAQVAYEMFVRPALRHMGAWNELYRTTIEAKVDKAWQSPVGKREFVRVRVTGSPREGYRAEVIDNPQNLHLSTLARANALAVVPENVTQVNVGDKLFCLALD